MEQGDATLFARTRKGKVLRISTKPLVIGHRGASADYPENTLEAFHGASVQGADWVELDVRRTVDGTLVVHHDPVVPGVGAIAEMGRAELPDHVATLAAALVACGSMGVNIEIKNDANEPGFDPTDRLARATLDVMDAATGGPYLVSSFDLDTIDAVRRLEPDVATGFLVLDPVQTHAASVANERGHGAIHPWNPCTTEDAVRAARSLGVAVNVWTVDDPRRIRQLADWGVDGIITNRPALARSTLSR